MNPRRADVLVAPRDEVGKVRIVARDHAVVDIVVGIPAKDSVSLREVVVYTDENLIIIERAALEAGVVDPTSGFGR